MHIRLEALQFVVGRSDHLLMIDIVFPAHQANDGAHVTEFAQKIRAVVAALVSA